MAQAIADFAVSAAGSFGDAGPAGADVNSRTRSTAADSGPVHVNTAATKVTLGQANGFYADGVNDSASNAHASDDGVFLRLHNGSLVSVQDQWLSAGKTYTLAAQVGVASGHGSVQDVKVSGWTSANNATNAMIPSSATALSFSAPDAQGQALADLNVPTTPSPAGLSPSTLRVSASTQSGITAPDNTTGQYAPLRGSEAANSRPWVSDGEIEDYRYYVTSGQVRVALISQGGAVSNVGYTVTNVSGTAPSTTSGTLKTEAAGVAWTSPATHVISSASADTKITLSSVPSGQSVVGGSCVDSASGVDPWATNRLAPADRPTVNDKSITIKGGTFGGSWTDLMCTFTIAEPSNASSSEFTLTPADGTAQVGGSVIGTVTVKDQSGALAGVTVRLASDDPLVTLKNSAGAAITSCVTNSVGQCQVHVTSDVVGKYANAVHATIQTTAGGAWVEIGPPSDPGRRSPKTVEFTAGDRPSAAKSEFTINEVGPITAGQSYTLTVTAYDGLGTANSGKGNFSSQATVLFSADPSADGTFAPANQCTTSGTGVCSVTFTSAKAGQTYALHAKVIDRQLIDWADVGGSGAAGKASPQNRAFQAGPPASAQSSLSVDPASLPVGGTATVKVALRDQHGNAVSGQATALNVTATTGATLSTTWTETPASSGVYVGTVTAATSGTYTVTATPTGAKVEGTVEFLTSTSVSPAKSTLVVSQAGPLQAGQDYTVVATLYDGVGTANGGKGNPVPKTTVEFSVGDDQDFGTKGFSESTCESDEAGACKVTFSSSKPGTFTLHAKVADPGQTGEPLTDVGGSPQTRVVTAGGPSRGNSELEVPLNGIVGQAAPVTLTLKDAFDNPVTGLSKDKVVLYVVPSSNTTLSEPVETPAGSGVYTSTVTSSVVNFYTVNADPWVPADRPLQALIGFVPAALPADGTATLTVTPNPARAGSSLTATLVVTNSNNQPVTGLGGVLTLASDGMGEGAIPARPTEWPTGTYTWNVDAVQAAGEYEAVVTDGGSGHAETDYELTQVASGVNSSIAISNSGTGNQANNTDFYTLTVTLKDLTGQPITDGLVAARDDLPKLSLVGPTNTDYTIWDLSHSGSGVYTAKLKASAAGNYTIAASY
ncbi:MAG: hypothetical protein LBS56_10270, partial [Propionibacteriaceae bacterium]|nr:hypothetical protein [Propionibacteriaceae bacterium]